MKTLSIAAVALIASSGAAMAQFEGTFGSNGEFGFNGTSGFSNCFSGGQGEAGVGGTNCSSGTVGSYSFGSHEAISGGFQAFTQDETQSQTSHSTGIQNQWIKSMNAGGVEKQGQSQVGNVWNTQSLTNSTAGTAIDGEINSVTNTGFEGTGFTNTNSYFDSGMGTTCGVMGANGFTCNMGGMGVVVID